MEKQALFMSQIVHVHFQTGDHVLKLFNCPSLLKKTTQIYYFHLNFQTTNLIKIST